MCLNYIFRAAHELFLSVDGTYPPKRQISARIAPDPGLQPARQIQNLEQNSAVHVIPLQDVALQVGFK